MVDTYQPVDVFDSMTESTFILKPPVQQKKQKPQQQQQQQHEKPNSRNARPNGKRMEALGAADKCRSEQSEYGDLAADGGYVRLFQGKEPIESMRLRQTLFEQTWAPLERLLVDTEKEVNNAGVSEVCRFVDTSYKRVETAEKGQLAAPFAETAAAVVFSGVNTGDHSNLFQSLQDQLIHGGHYVALLESQYCPSLPTMLKCLLDQIYECISIDSSSEKGTKSKSKMSAAAAPMLPASIGAKAIGYDMSLLRLWWEQVCSRKKDSSRVVVILQDFEGFAPMVVDDFIRIATNYCREIPIVVVFGLATSYESIHQSLTKASISMLNVERFNLQRSKQCIDAAIRSVFVESASVLSFGAEAYKSLLDQFLLYSFSITGFVKKLKFAAMDFFYAQPLSVLSAMVCPGRDGCAAASIRDCPIRLSRDQIELIRMQRSVQRFLDARMDSADGRKYTVQALVDDNFLQDTVIPDMLRQLVSYRQCYSLGISMVLAMQNCLPESFRKPLRTLHYYGISQAFDECTHWKTLSAALRRMKAPEMKQLVERLEAVVTAAKDTDFVFAESKNIDIPALIRKAATLVADPEALPDDGDDDEDQSIKDVARPDMASRRIRTRTDMENRPFLLFDKDSSDQVLRALDRCCGYIESALRVCLSPYQGVPLHEVFYYRHSLLLDTTFSAQPRAAVQAALGKTQYYIDCDCCKSASQDSDELSSDGHDSGDDHRIMPSMNDTSIAYRLHQECGRMINLYDWFSAFSSVVEQEDPLAQKEAARSEIQARFLRAVEEMRFLGFIKSTQRKTDHVVRLTWGM